MIEFEMTQEQLDRLLSACRPVAMIALQCGAPRSPQENANEAWKALAKELGFVWDTAKPSPKGERFFTAIPAPRQCPHGEPLAGGCRDCDREHREATA